MTNRGLIRFLSGIVVLLHVEVLFAQETESEQDSAQTYTPTFQPTYQPAYRFGDPFSNRPSRSPLFLKDPSSLDMQVGFNPDSTAADAGVTYSVYENIGNLNFRPASFMSFEEFNRYNNTQLNREYFKDRSAGLDGESAVSGRDLIPRLYISPVFDRIFGGSYVDIQPNGFVNIDFGGRFQRVDNPAIPLRQRKNGSFNFDQQISMNVVGKIGEKLAISANFDNNNTFDFQNNLKIEYTGYEEDIIKKIEIGNVSMPVSNSLITGGSSLFGVKGEFQFGKLWVSTIFSQQRGKSEVQTYEGGFEGQQFEIQSSNYDDDRHFFLGHFFRNNYERWLLTAPMITSGVNVTRVEVYVMNRNNDTQTTRNIVALMDLGENAIIDNNGVTASGTDPRTRNDANDLNELFGSGVEYNVNNVDDYLTGLYPSFESSKDYVKITTARKLEQGREYTINPELGYISLLRRLNTDEILAVSYEYTFQGQKYTVGELSESYQGRSDDEVIYLKMLRPNQINTDVPTWDLMMKNIYTLNANNVSSEGFELRIIYKDDLTGQDNPALHEGERLKDVPLVEVFGLDRLNQNQDRQPDGNFDFIDGVTISRSNGNIIFPVLEPFGETLENQFDANSEGNLISKYVYNQLYNQPKAQAELNTTLNKFFLAGVSTSGSSSVYKLPGINISEGSVVVTAGGITLQEGTDYDVDYNFGEVRILNDGIIQSGKTISIAYEKADLFNFQTRTLTGANFEYRFDEDVNLSATVLNLSERQGGISRYTIGSEPTNNTKYGFALNLRKDSRFLTKMVDALPLISTKEKSSITFNAEFAQLIPGTNNVVNGEGTSYIDDFETAITPINIDGWQAWKLAATPKDPKENFDSGLESRRSRLAWYTIDNSIFYRSTGSTRPDNIDDGDLSNHYERPVLPQEIFPERDQTQVNINESLFDLAFFPRERGMYNYSAGYENVNYEPDRDGNSELRERWGGITRANTNEVNFDNSNIEYIEFWLMDPFINSDDNRGIVKDGFDGIGYNQANTSGGRLIFNLGSISEDINPDSRHAFENGLPEDGQVIDANVSTWGQVTSEQFLTNFFDNTSGARENQDIGIDGLSNEEEERILSNVTGGTDPSVGELTEGDISGDDFYHPLDEFFDNNFADPDIVQRYKYWNGMERNSPPITNSNAAFIPSSTNLPDNEDLNQDNTISDLEEYFRYNVPLNPTNDPTLNSQGIYLDIDALEQAGYLNDYIVGDEGAAWYQVRIPIRKDPETVGTPSFQTIKYYRMYLTGWSEPVVLRFANLRLVGSNWRKYDQALQEPGLDEIPNVTTSDFNVSVVSIEENSTPTVGGSPYVLPPGFDRDVDNTTALNRRFNEQSLQLCVEDLRDKDARAVYKNVSYDLINYGRLKMFLHGEAYQEDMVLESDSIKAFVRLGTDFDQNYYEIELDLIMTPPDVTSADANIERLVWPLENEIDVSIDELLGIKSIRSRQNLDETIRQRFRSDDGRYNFYIKGRPDISAVRVLMIGVRNSADNIRADKSVCLWANEFRVTDFDSNAGWAANARLSTQLADLGTISASTRYTSIGFGGIQQQIAQRTREEVTQYDVSANVNVDKFLRSDKTGLKVPMFVSYEKSVATPQFDPFDPDTPLDATLASFDTEEERQQYKRIAEDRTTRRSINFTNVRKEKVRKDAPKRVYDIENFSFNYAYSDRVTSNSSTPIFLDKTVSGGFNYNYTPINVEVKPFGKSEKMKSPYLALLKDFNFSLLPSNFSVSADLRRNFVEKRYYTNEFEVGEAFYERLFTFNRRYAFKWSFTKSLSFSYTASANALIDEPESAINGDINTPDERRYIWNQIKNLGRLKNYTQDMTLNYKLPIDKIPVFDWISADARFTAGYGWIAGSINQPQTEGDNVIIDSLYFGNFIDNRRVADFGANVSLQKLYDKVGILKNASKSEKTTVSQGLLRFLTMVKDVSGSYQITESTSLPGFAITPFLFGLDSGFNAPGLGFILGSQDPSIKQKAARNGWLVENDNLNSPFQQSVSTDLDFSVSLEPFKDIRVQVTMNRGINNTYQELFRYSETLDDFESLTPTRSGSYNTSFLTIGTAFEGLGPNNASEAFTQFEQNLLTIRERLNTVNVGGTYDTISQDVMIPSFIAAYSGTEATSADLSPFPRIPLPNWRVDFAGLGKIPALAEVFSSITVSHGYNASYTVSNFINNLDYGADLVGLQNNLLDYPLAESNDSDQLVPVYIINQVVISEQFAPLIGINVRTKNNLSARLDFKKSRNLALNLTNAQVTETNKFDITGDLGFAKEGMVLPWRFQGRRVSLQNEISFRVAASYGSDLTIQRKVFDVSTVTNGRNTFRLSPTIGYKINQRLDLNAYYQRTVTEPKIGSSPPTASSAFGIQLRFGLAQ